ncbi:MAG TPA: hypothetical protein VFF65_03190 [Phycisphaerales bacterium]|nr:hypothetical protein [Phycisphaerales bacterium]
MGKHGSMVLRMHELSDAICVRLPDGQIVHISIVRGKGRVAVRAPQALPIYRTAERFPATLNAADNPPSDATRARKARPNPEDMSER